MLGLFRTYVRGNQNDEDEDPDEEIGIHNLGHGLSFGSDRDKPKESRYAQRYEIKKWESVFGGKASRNQECNTWHKGANGDEP